MDGLVLRSHWYSAVQGTFPSLVFNLLVQLKVKSHKELHCSHFLVKLIYDPGRLVLDKLLTAFCEINLSLIKGLCGEGVGAGRESRGVVGRYECRVSHFLCMRVCVCVSVWANLLQLCLILCDPK